MTVVAHVGALITMGTLYRAVCRSRRERFEPEANKSAGWHLAGEQLLELMTLGAWYGAPVEVWNDNSDLYHQHQGEDDVIDAWPNLWRPDWRLTVW